MKTLIESRNIGILLSFLLILASLSSFNQVIYYDIDPDTTISENNGHYDLDFINDDSVDFQLRLRFIGNYSLGEVEALINNDSCYVSGDTFEGCDIAVKLILNDTINAYISNNSYWQWYDNPSLKMAFIGLSWCPSPFLGWDNAYIGFKWIEKSVPYVCWVRLDVADDASWFTVKDYAYGPYTVIVGSQSSTFLNETKENKFFQVYRNENNIIVKAFNGVNIRQGKLLNLLAQEFPIIKQKDQIIINSQQLSPGLYLLYLSTDQGNSTIKVLIN